MTTNKKHGGSRPGAGRRPSEQKTFAKQVYLYKHQLALTSKEIRARIDAHDKQTKDDPQTN